MNELPINKPLPFMSDTVLLWQSPAVKIGKTYWKMVYYTKKESAFDFENNKWLDYNVNDFVFWNGYSWLHSREHKRYNPHDGVFAGLPKGLRTLYERYEKEIETLSASDCIGEK